MLDAIFYAVMIASMIAAGVAGYTANEKAKEAREAEEQTVYVFGDASGVTTSADVPEIIITD